MAPAPAGQRRAAAEQPGGGARHPRAEAEGQALPRLPAQSSGDRFGQKGAPFCQRELELAKDVFSCFLVPLSLHLQAGDFVFLTCCLHWAYGKGSGMVMEDIDEAFSTDRLNDSASIRGQDWHPDSLVPLLELWSELGSLIFLREKPRPGDNNKAQLLRGQNTTSSLEEAVWGSPEPRETISLAKVALSGRFSPDHNPVMEDSGIQRGIWDGDAKAVQQCLTDIFTSVYTTCDIPENAIFGPCVLSHTSLYDSIAFIALKSTDKRTVPYIFRVDTSAANGSSEGLMWLRLVQSARDKEEQNLEAYIKNGQLFYRSLRRIAKDEELLVCQRFQFEFPYVAHLRFRCPKRLPSADMSPPDEQGGSVGTKDHGGGGGGKDQQHQQQQPQQQQQQQEAPLGPGPKFCKAGPIHHYPATSPEGSNPPSVGGGGGGTAKPSTDFHNLARELENSGGGSCCSPARSLSCGSSGGGHQEAELSPEGNATGGGKGKRKFSEEGAEGGGGPGLVGGRGRFAERPLPASKEDLVCTPQQYRASGSYFGLEENSRLFAPPSPETGEAKRSAFVEVKKVARAAGLQEEGAADTAGGAAEDPDAGGGGGGGASTPVAASPVGAEKLLAPRPGGPLPGRLEGGSPARGSAFTSVPQLGGAGGNGAGGGAGAGAAGGGGGGQGAASDERKSAFSQPARSFAQLSPLVLGQKLSALEPCHPGDGVGPTRLYPSSSDPLAVKLQGAADLNGACGALPSAGGGLPKQSPFLYATAFWPKSSAAAAAAAAAAAGPLQLQLPSALTLLPPSFTSLCLPAQNWCAKCNASFRMTSDLVYHMRSHHKKEYAMEPLVKRRREEKLKCPICNESFRERHHLSRHMTSHN
ncbi:PR domain zinc finger protein 8 [Galemys pyrenaicus]|uniref:PR domain zinc finger protein 8 n=1 Tax=Galemys pyrenaicus TaxID=202257 RepID=A0A8J6DNX4_GALPY|nr:PR domain zinc finger protein 8 [Galemys pyrenaicus]